MLNRRQLVKVAACLFAAPVAAAAGCTPSPSWSPRRILGRLCGFGPCTFIGKSYVLEDTTLTCNEFTRRKLREQAFIDHILPSRLHSPAAYKFCYNASLGKPYGTAA